MHLYFFITQICFSLFKKISILSLFPFLVCFLELQWGQTSILFLKYNFPFLTVLIKFLLIFLQPNKELCSSELKSKNSSTKSQRLYVVRPIYQLEPLFYSYSYYYIGSNYLLSFPSLFLKNKIFNELKTDFSKNTIFSKSHQFVTVP